MTVTLLLLQEQCDPIEEFMAVIYNTKNEVENTRATEYLGRGIMSEDILDNHHYIIEELLYPLIDKYNPIQLYVEITKFHIAIMLK